LQEALEFETKRREQAEQTLKQAASTDSLRVLNGKKVYFYAQPDLISILKGQFRHVFVLIFHISMPCDSFRYTNS
jgi:cytochrome c biogenesis protein ResB